MISIWLKFKKYIKIAWYLILALITLYGGYQGFFANKPDISFQITNQSNVLDIREPLKDLKILFQDDNIQEKNLNLRIYTIKVENTGTTNIEQNDFDQNDIWGIKVENGKAIDTRLIESNSEYLKNHIFPQIKDGYSVEFSKSIFDRGTYFILNILVLHDKSLSPHLYQLGKIARIQQDRSEISTLQKSEPFMATLFYGDWRVQIVRIIIYLVLFILVIIVIAFVTDKIQKNKKAKLAQNQK